MDTLKESSSKRELIIKPWDDVIDELLTNEDAFSQISKQHDKFETVLSDALKRIVTLENENGKLQRSILDIEISASKYQREFSELMSKYMDLEKSIRSMETTPPTVTSPPPPPTVTPANKCISPVIFTHNLVPIFNEQRSLNSKGVAIFQDETWIIQMSIEILAPLQPDTVGYINYLNNQVPVGFAPTTVVSIAADKNGVYIEADKIMLGYITYVPDAASTYPHTLGINMTLK